MDIGAYILTIDDGREHLQLTDQEGWASTIQCGMTIVMNIVMSQWFNRAIYKCPFCECWNSLKGNNGKSSIDWWVFDGSLQTVMVLLMNSQSILPATIPGQSG